MNATARQTIVQNDAYYCLNFTLQDNEGSPFDLTDAELHLKVQTPGAEILKFTGEMAIISETAGTCKYVVQPGDFDEPGQLYGEIEIRWPATGEIQTVPDIVIDVRPELPRE